MKALIPVAGHGSRLAPHTLFIQKCLLPVAGKPVLEHIIDKLINIDIEEITLIIGHLGNQVREFCKKIDKVKFSFIEQEKRLGLGHAIYMGLEKSEEPVLIVLGDAILELDYNKLISSQSSSIGVDRVEDPERFGIAELLGGRIIKVVEKPINSSSNLAMIGIYYISSQNALINGIEHIMKNEIRTNDEYQLTDAFTVMIKDGHYFSAFEIDNCLDCGIPETLFSTNRTLLNRGINNALHPTVVIENSKLEYCTISEGCTIINSQLNNVIMLPGSKIMNQNLENEIIGSDSKLVN